MKSLTLLVRVLALPVVLALFGAAGCAELSQWRSSPDPATVPKELRNQPRSAPVSASASVEGSLSATPPRNPTPDLPSNPPSAPPTIDAKLPSIFVASDSTAARGSGERQQGWGVPFATYFDPAKINIVNRARGGRSSRTFITEGLWDALLADVRSNDIVLIQFGHNDGGAVNDNLRARGSIPGLGEETQEIDNLITKKHEIVHTFGWYMRKMIADTKAKGATPIVLGLTVRDIWSNGKVERGPGRYTPWSSDIAKAAGAPFVDLTALVADQFDPLGADKVKLFYPQDPTHFNLAGAEIHASNVVFGLRALPGNPISRFLSAKGLAVPGPAVQAARPAGPGLPTPANAALPSLYLIGDSTVRNGRGDGAGGQWGWGDFLAPKFDTNKINVVNRAVGGLSSRTYFTGGQWDRVLGMLKKGDFVMMQFGHNDDGAVNDASRARASLRGVGEETQEIDNMLTKKHEVVHTYGWYLRKFVNDAKAKGATPIICSLIPRKTWVGGKIARNKDTFAGWAEQVAKAEGVGFVDLNEIIASRYDALGPDKVEPLFAVNGGPHTTAAGAELNAQCVVAGLKMIRDDPLAPFLNSSNP